jgi:hypothetical protein
MVAAPARADEPRKRRVDVGVALIGVGAIGLVTGLAFTARSAALRDDLAARCAAGCDWAAPAVRDRDAAGHRANTIAAVGFVGGGAAVLGGVVLYVIGSPVAVTPAPRGAVVTARLAF